MTSSGNTACKRRRALFLPDMILRRLPTRLGLAAPPILPSVLKNSMVPFRQTISPKTSAARARAVIDQFPNLLTPIINLIIAIGI